MKTFTLILAAIAVAFALSACSVADLDAVEHALQENYTGVPFVNGHAAYHAGRSARGRH